MDKESYYFECLKTFEESKQDYKFLEMNHEQRKMLHETREKYFPNLLTRSEYEPTNKQLACPECNCWSNLCEYETVDYEPPDDLYHKCPNCHETSYFCTDRDYQDGYRLRYTNYQPSGRVMMKKRNVPNPDGSWRKHY